MSPRLVFALLPFLSLAACSKPAAPPAAEKKAAVEQKAVTPVAGAATKLAVGQKAHCPVTGEEFVVAEGTVQVEHEGKYYAFCCAECQPTFAKDPAKYAKKN